VVVAQRRRLGDDPEAQGLQAGLAADEGDRVEPGRAEGPRHAERQRLAIDLHQGLVLAHPT
jgi:hypothetical protein